ncbi:MAG: GEVED domain-containing protein, partial [Dysgonamonadaceae bacterium]|nr:GEVED domain-containing protein [Dysgonamonadaceae bacterium]
DWNNDFDFEDAGEEIVSQTGLASGAGTATYAVPSSTPAGTYRMRIYACDNDFTPTPCGSVSWGEVEDYTLHVLAAPVCSRPSSISAGSITASGATITWTPAGDETSWEFEYSVNPNFSGATTEILSTPSKVLSELNASTNYYIRVRTICTSENSEWREESFTTPCGLAKIPYSENFNNITAVDYTSEGNLPSCWNSFTNHPAYKAPHVIANGMYNNSMGAMTSNALLFVNSVVGNTSYAVLPEFNTAYNLLQMSFYVRWESITYFGTLDLGYVTDASNFSTSNATFTSLKQIPTSANATIVTENLSVYTIPVGARLAFKYYLNGDYYGLIIDDINLLIVPPTVTTQAATEKTQTSAVLNKTVTAGAETTIVEGFKYRKVGETTWENSTDGVLSGLIPNTEYEFYAYANTAIYPNNNGVTLTFSTLAHTAPVVTTLPVVDYDATSAVLLKSVTVGTETITAQGFQYKKVSETDWENSTDGILSGLMPNTEYEFYAYATTETFDIHGETLSFSTIITGIDDILENPLSIYPNPVIDELNIKNGNLKINSVQILDITGGIIYNLQSTINNSINVSSLPQGVYLIRINTDNGVKTERFIKK